MDGPMCMFIPHMILKSIIAAVQFHWDFLHNEQSTFLDLWSFEGPLAFKAASLNLNLSGPFPIRALPAALPYSRRITSSIARNISVHRSAILSSIILNTELDLRLNLQKCVFLYRRSKVGLGPGVEAKAVCEDRSVCLTVSDWVLLRSPLPHSAPQFRSHSPNLISWRWGEGEGGDKWGGVQGYVVSL